MDFGYVLSPARSNLSLAVLPKGLALSPCSKRLRQYWSYDTNAFQIFCPKQQMNAERYGVRVVVKDVPKLAQYGERHSRHLGHADACQMVDRYGWSPFTDILREITDPLKITCNSRDTQNFSQVDSDRLAFFAMFR